MHSSAACARKAYCPAAPGEQWGIQSCVGLCMLQWANTRPPQKCPFPWGGEWSIGDENRQIDKRPVWNQCSRALSQTDRPCPCKLIGSASVEGTPFNQTRVDTTIVHPSPFLGDASVPTRLDALSSVILWIWLSCSVCFQPYDTGGCRLLSECWHWANVITGTSNTGGVGWLPRPPWCVAWLLNLHAGVELPFIKTCHIASST